MSEEAAEEKEYEVRTLRKPQHVADMGREVLAFHHVFGSDSSKRDNFAFIKEDVIVYTLASAVVFENLKFCQKEYILAIDEGGVGCVAVHPSR